MQKKLVEVRPSNKGGFLLFVKGKEALAKDFLVLKEKVSIETKRKYELSDSEYLTACFEVRRSLPPNEVFQ